MNMHSWHGFTLIEMMVIITIASIITAVAIPAYRTFLRNQEASNFSGRLANSFRLAKSEAIKRKSFVSVCPTATGITPSATPANNCISNTNWNAWKIFIDAGNDGSDSSDTPIQYYDGSRAGAIIASATTAITYNPMGFVTRGATTIFTIRPTGCTGNSGREFTVNASGSIKVKTIACP
jgi:type IV fimbrial biogenesis protein FimT